MRRERHRRAQAPSKAVEEKTPLPYPSRPLARWSFLSGPLTRPQAKRRRPVSPPADHPMKPGECKLEARGNLRMTSLQTACSEGLYWP